MSDATCAWTGGHSAAALAPLKVCGDASGVTVSW
jgi:hypothetical protein